MAGAYAIQTPLFSKSRYFPCANLQRIERTESRMTIVRSGLDRNNPKIIGQNYSKNYSKSKTGEQALSVCGLYVPFCVSRDTWFCVPGWHA